MKALFISIIGVMLSTSAIFSAPYTPEDMIRTEGDWTLIIITLVQGTRSQITLGKLKYKKAEVIGEPGHILNTPFGRVIWRGSYNQGYARGWLPADTDTNSQQQISCEIPKSTLGGVFYTKEKDQ